jgi:hypothetical protein
MTALVKVAGPRSQVGRATNAVSQRQGVNTPSVTSASPTLNSEEPITAPVASDLSSQERVGLSQSLVQDG